MKPSPSLLRAVLLAAVLGAGLLSWQSATAAESAIDAFNSLTAAAQTSGPGYYTSGTRNIFVAGSTRVWVPSQHVQLFNISPPSFSAGCGGISMFFGGFSFINGAQIGKLVKQVMMQAMGYTIHLVIRTLCPMCSDILSEMSALAQKAAGQGMNTCRMAQSLVNGAASAIGIGAQPGGLSSSCANTASGDDAASSSFVGAINDICKGTSKALGWLQNDVLAKVAGGGADQADQEVAKHATQSGNALWKALTLAGYSDTYVKEVIISMVGAQSFTKLKGESKAAMHVWPGWSGVYEQGTTDLFDLLLYGAKPSATLAAMKSGGLAISASMRQQIQQAEQENLASLPFYICTASTGHSPEPNPGPRSPAKGNQGGVPNLSLCDAYDPANLTVGDVAASGKNPLITETGLIVHVYNALSDAVNAIAAGKPVPETAVQLMQVTPLPLYRMVNIAAVYPQTASQMVSTYSTVVALLIARHVITQWVSRPSAPVPGIAASANLRPVFAKLTQLLSQINVAGGKQIKAISSAITLQDGLLGEIKQVNDVMYQTMAGTGIQGNLLFTQGLAAGIAQGH